MGIQERVLVPEVLGHRIGGVCIGGVGSPGDQVFRGLDVFRNGLFGQDVLACCEGFLDVFGLREDGETAYISTRTIEDGR